MLVWVQGQGFPKSLDVSKAFDKAAGAERELVAIGSDGAKRKPRAMAPGGAPRNVVQTISIPATDFAKKWQGWGTALKPAATPILLARKPLSESNVAANVLKWGTGGLNIDGCRVAGHMGTDRSLVKPRRTDNITYGKSNSTINPQSPLGRWPANFLLSHAEGCEKVGKNKIKSNGHYPKRRGKGSAVSGPSGHRGQKNLVERSTNGEAVESWRCVEGCPVGMFPESIARPVKPENIGKSGSGEKRGLFGNGSIVQSGYYDSETSAARFFYCAKAATKERWFLCKTCSSVHPAKECPRHMKHDLVYHPTQKPLELMRWLVRLVTPRGGTVLDPFGGTGTTGAAASQEGFKPVLIERDTDYTKIVRIRCAGPILREAAI